MKCQNKLQIMTLLELVGNTPLVEINCLNPNKNVKFFGKLEGNNPGGSVKDRPALNMIRSAVERGELKKGMKLIEDRKSTRLNSSHRH